ncbi:hypothetical protein [Catenulispora yoronensis]
MTEDNAGGIGYEQLVTGDYVRHSCGWNAASTWCGKPMRSMRRLPDPIPAASIQACAKCAQAESEAAFKASGSH